MTTTVFEEFFEKFVERVKGTGPILVIVDGHLSHTSLKTVDLAIKNDITILKLPPHCTDLLQPLDVACFSPLKRYYDSELFKYTQSTGGRQNLRKDLFVKLLCSVWNKGLSKENVIAGFKATGIHPVDSTKYKVTRLDKLKLKTYNDWVANGKPTNSNNEPALPTGNTQNLEMLPPPAPHDDVNIGASTSCAISQQSGARASASSTASGSNTQKSQGRDSRETVPVSPEVLGNFSKQKLISELLTTSGNEAYEDLVDALMNRGESEMLSFFQCLNSRIFKHGMNVAPTSIEAILHSRGRSATPLTKKRRNISMQAQIITDEEYANKITELNQPKQNPKKAIESYKQGKF